MIKDVTSFGIFMLIENTIILVLIGDLIRRVVRKFGYIKHQHLYWNSGVILLAYFMISFVNNTASFYTSYINYLDNHNPIDMQIVAARVFDRSTMLMGKILLWYYTVKGGFNLFKWKQ